MDLKAEIARVAYEIYEKSGRVDGRHAENWFEAEKIVMGRMAKEKSLAQTGEKGLAGRSERSIDKPRAAKTAAKKPAAKKTAAKKTTTRKPRAKSPA